MFKIIGLVLLILSGTSIGLMFSIRSLVHINFLKEYINLILNMKTEIKYSQKPIFEILKDYNSKECLSECIKKCIELSNNNSFEIAWKSSFSNLSTLYGVSLEEEKIINNFASKLGTSDIDNQINYCEYNISLINPYLQNAIENKTKNQKLPVILGISLSLIICIVFI